MRRCCHWFLQTRSTTGCGSSRHSKRFASTLPRVPRTHVKQHDSGVGDKKKKQKNRFLFTRTRSHPPTIQKQRMAFYFAEHLGGLGGGGCHCVCRMSCKSCIRMLIGEHLCLEVRALGLLQRLKEWMGELDAPAGAVASLAFAKSLFAQRHAHAKAMYSLHDH